MFDHNNPNSQDNFQPNVNGEYHFANPYVQSGQNQQSYVPPVQNNFQVPGKPPKAPKEKKKSFLTRKSAALLLAFCVLASAGMGIGGGMLGYQLSRDNTPTSTTSNNTTNAQQMSNQTTTPEGELTVEQIAAKAADSVVEIDVYKRQSPFNISIATACIHNGHSFRKGRFPPLCLLPKLLLNRRS